jgi:GMP synthase-like glutamine amidotransferase
MILYVVTDTCAQYRKNTIWFTMGRALEKTARDACLILHYSQVSPDTLAQIKPWAVCHSGGSTDYSEYGVLRDRRYRRAVMECGIPQIGFCGGHQILASFFGSTLGPMRKLRPDEPNPCSYNPAYFKEWGVYPVRIVKDDPLFRSCGKVLRVKEYHYFEVKTLGKDLMLLASSKECRVQVYRHRTRLLYGTQFHPEQPEKLYPDGTTILKNFFRMARHQAG